MRHQVKRHRIARDHAHRKATLSALTTALIKHKRIKTTLAKAKALRVYAEPIINRGKEDTQHNRRQVFRHLQDKEAVKELFGEISGKIADRPGGYTRVIKLGTRSGDAAEMALIELVDYNDIRPGGETGGRRRRTRRGSSGGGRSRRGAGTTPTAQTTTPAATQTETAIASDATVQDDTVVATETVETPVAPEQEVPVPERTEPNAEAEAAAEEQKSEAAEEQPEASAKEQQPEAGEDEEKKAE